MPNLRFYQTSFQLFANYILVGFYYAWLGAIYVLAALQPFWLPIGIAAIFVMAFAVHRMRR